MNNICTGKLLRLLCRGKLCKKTLYSGIELICEFPKQCLFLRVELELINSEPVA